MIGIVADVRTVALSEAAPLNLYLPIWVPPIPISTVAVAVRTTSTSVASGIRDVIRRLDPQLAIPAIETMEQLVAESIAPRRFQMQLLMMLAAAALLLAGLGVYAVGSQRVSERTNEIGIRMAVGADPARLRLFVVRQSMTAALVGMVAGIGLSFVVGRFLRTQLFGLAPTDPATLAGGAAFLLIVIIVAAYIPARQATRVDPMRALRWE